MAEHRRPSPVQPPFVATLPDMAQTQRASHFPNLDYLGRPEQRSSHGLPLPPIQSSGAPATHPLQGRTLPPIQLPPLSGPGRGCSPVAPDVNKLSINQLLTHNSPAPTRSSPEAQRGTSSHETTSHAGSAPRPMIQHATHVPPPVHAVSYANQAPPQQFQVMHASPPEPCFRVTGGLVGYDKPRYSPTTASRSPTTSYYGSEPSPRTSVTPASRPSVSRPPPLNYSLSIRQQPIAARACGYGERDRRVIDPPPILELRISDRETGRPENDWNGMLALHCTLLSPDGKDDETEVPPTHPDLYSTRRLMGTLVASPYQAKDDHGVAGTFFVFPDLSCRSPGKYRLRFKLMRIDPTQMSPGMSSPSVASIVTDVFSVYTAKDFPGMRASSALLKALRRQGLNVGVKKGSEARKGKGKAKKESSSSEEDGSSDGSEDERRGSNITMRSESTGRLSPSSRLAKKKLKRRRRDS
ncbi:hypothetical protein KC347_g925 [Hortaea werneckii]|nr:hypothetical protein KC347_g925 [Hortaea werneckii]